MSSRSSAYLTHRLLGPLVHVRLGGTLDETFGAMDLRFRPPIDDAFVSDEPSTDRDTAWVLDLAHLERVTSWGVQHWLKFIKEAERSTRSVLIARAPPCVVDQLNMIEGFQGSATVLSVLAPYVCRACNHAQLRPLVLAEHMAAIRAGQAPVQSCTSCYLPLEFDDFAVHFFAFATTQREAPLAPQVVTFNEWLCGPDSTDEVDARFLAHISGANLYAVESEGLTPSKPAIARPTFALPPRRVAAVASKPTAPAAPPSMLVAYLGQTASEAAPARTSVLAAGYRQAGRPDDANVFIKQLTTTLAVDPGGRPVVNLFDGQLDAHHAALFEAPGPLLLLAGREVEKTPSHWELSLLSRLLRGVKLLPPGSSETTYKIDSMEAIHAVSQATGELVAARKGASATRDIAIDVAYELMSNALLDAPVDDRGEPKYAFDRENVATVDAADVCECSLSEHEGLLFIRVIDHFGRLTKAHLANAVARSGARQVALNMTGGGAGLGFPRILAGADALVVCVRPSQRTEVCAVIRLSETARRRNRLPKSLFVDAPS